MVINIKSSSELSGFYVVFEGATNIEYDGIYGLSHLMEHLICKNFEHLRPKFEKYGIEWNAYTTNNEIVFFFTGLEKYLSNWRKDLVDLITNFDVSKSQFQNEKKIILQEYSMNFSDQSECHFLNLNRKLFKNYQSIGKRTDLENLKFIDCINFFEKQFQSPSKIINVSKDGRFDIDFESNLPITTNKLKFGPYTNVELEPTRKTGEKVSIIFMSKFIEDDFNYISFINSMLSMGLSSPLYSVLREKQGLVYGVHAKNLRIGENGTIVIGTQTTNENKDKVIDSIKMILEKPEKYLTPKRFEIIKNAYKIKYIKDKIDRYKNVNLWISPKKWSVKEILPIIDYEKVMDVYDKSFGLDNFYISDDKTEFT